MLKNVLKFGRRRNDILSKVSSRYYGAVDNFRAVIFDMGGVVLPSPFPMTIEYEAEKKIPAGTIWKAIKFYGSKGSWPKLEIGELDADEFGIVFSEECSQVADQQVDVRDFLPYLEQGMSNPIKEVLEAVKCLKQQGYKTALLTNNWKKSDGSTLLPFDTSDFDVIVESAVEGINKPSPPIFTLCLNKLGVGSHEAIFLDDITSNLQAAKSSGIFSIQVEDVFVAINELEERLQVKLTEEKRGTLPVSKEMQINMTNLNKYFQNQLETKVEHEAEIFQYSHCPSNPTYLIDFGPNHKNIVLRTSHHRSKRSHVIAREYRVMNAVSKFGVKIPKLVSLCEDLDVIGRPFYLSEQVIGNILKDTSLPGMMPRTRTTIYNEMITTLSQIHNINISSAQLDDFGKKGNFMKKQISTWTRQYKMNETKSIPYMNLLINWLPVHIDTQEATTIIHGDYQLENLIFDSKTQKLSAVLDWELSTLGNPLFDLASCCLPHYIPRKFSFLSGLQGYNLQELGIPSVDELIEKYSSLRGVDSIKNFNFYLAFSLFKLATIMQSVYKQTLQEKELSNTNKLVEELAEIGWTFASKEGFRIFNQTLGRETSLPPLQ